ncbi:MAG: SRPBCC family protein [Gemmatimonadaceae bacterium]
MVLETTGPRRVEGDRSAAANRNVGDLERWVSVLGGSALAVWGLERRDVPGAALALLGAAMIHRGATGHCYVYDAIGVSTDDGARGFIPHADQPAGLAATVRASKSVKVERSIAVSRSPAELYALWRDPANVARFMDQVESVEPIDDRHARWTMRGPAGRRISWVAEVIVDVPDERIAWKSAEGSQVPNAGSVHFDALPDARGTEVRLVMDYEPPAGLIGNSLAKLLGADPDVMVRESLRRFKALAEVGEIQQA